MQPRTKDALILLGLICLCIGINLPAYWHVSASTTMLTILSGDEAVYYGWLEGFYTLLQNHDIYGLMVFKDPWGYGTLFWYVYGVISWPIDWFNSFPAVIILLRCISAAWLGVSLFFIYKIIHQLGQPRSIALLGAIMLLTAPGYYFYFKAFSAEFILLAFSLASVYFLIKDAWTGGRCYLISLVLLGIAIGLKVALLLFVPIYGGYILFVHRQHLVTTRFMHYLIKAGMCLLIGFIICNPYVLITHRSGANYYYNLLRINMTDNATGHGTDITGIDYQAWYHSVVLPKFFPLPILLLFIMGYSLSIVSQFKRKQYSAIVLLSLSILYCLYIMLQVKKLWAWYLFPGISLLPIGLYLVNFADYAWLKKYAKIQPFTLALLVMISLYWNLSAIRTAYMEFIGRDEHYAES